MTVPPCDTFRRPIDYLRVSVTDRCNLRCVYCMPAEGIALQRHEDILRYEEIERLVRVAAGLGISRVRLTGGEPLARAGIANLVEMLAAVPGLHELTMTTNGTLLPRYAKALAEGGLQRVNVSLDTLRPERFRQITRCGELADALAGIEAAQSAGLAPVKINMVVVRGLNDDEVGDMARMTMDAGWHVRYIEIMPLGEAAHWSGDGYVSSAETRDLIERQFGPLERASLEGSGPARYWRIPGAAGTLGFISPVSEHFCHACNRLRLTADGRLLPCLLSQDEINVRLALRAGADDDELASIFRSAIAHKPSGHRLTEQLVPHDRLMSQTGG